MTRHFQETEKRNMGMYDSLKDVPRNYDDQVKLWGCELTLYSVGDEVPNVGGHENYSVRLNSFESPPPPARYIHVQEGRILTMNAERPLSKFPVFSKWGGEEDQVNPFVEACEHVIRGQKEST